MEIDVIRKVLEKNDHAAEENRALLEQRGITCINLLGGAGCGKTTVLEELIPQLSESLRVGVLEGDLATTRDAERIARLGVPVVQLLTEGGCHLSAGLVQQGLGRLPLDELDVLIIENVGNPICPANFDLGEQFRISVLSITEGDDKPSKYPLLFRKADVVLLTKCDLLPQTNFNLDAAEAELRRLNPEAHIICTEHRTRHGIDQLASWVMCQCLQPV